MPDFAGFHRMDVGGVPLLWLPDRRFKTFRFSFYARRPLDERAAARSLLPSLLVRGTRHNPDRPSIARRMQDLFGAAVQPASSKLGESHVFRMALDTVSGAHLPGAPDQLTAGLELFREMLTEPALDGDCFPAAVFEREREQTAHLIRALADDKGTYAREQALAAACRGEPMAIPEHGGLDAVLALNGAAVEKARVDFLSHGELWAVAMGDLPDPELLRDRVAALIDALPKRAPEDVPVPAVVEPRAPRETVETTELRQSKLVMVFRTPPIEDPAVRMGRNLFVTMLGGGPSARLFTEVREKRSLAYYASASADRHKDLLLIQVGLDRASVSAATEEIRAQLAALQAGDFEQRELEVARSTLLTALQAVDDSIAQRTRFTADQWIRGGDRAPRDVAQLCAAATPEHVVAGAAGIWLDQTYLLTDAAAETTESVGGER